MEYVRNCPECGIELKTKNKYWHRKAIKEGKKCSSCALTGRKFSEETKRKMSKNHANVSGENNPFYGKKHDDSTRKVLSKRQRQRFTKEEEREKMSKSQLKRFENSENHPFCGKTHSDQTKKKLRVLTIEKLENMIGQVHPFYNPKSIPILERKAKELGITDLQHAENGGEFYIKEIGYWVDGYSAEKNIVIEYDEKYHFTSDSELCDRDIRRQKEIEEYLGCKFIRIRDEN